MSRPRTLAAHPRRPFRAALRLCACALLGALAPGAGVAQSSIHQTSLDTVSHPADKPVGFTSGSFIAVPIPIQNPTISTGLAVGAGYLFTVDEGSKPSFVGLGGFKTNNGSTGYAAGGNLSFGEGRWTVSGSVGYADLSYDLYIADRPVPIEQSGTIAQASLAYGLTRAFSIGLALGYIESDAGLAKDSLPVEIARDFAITTATADLQFLYDTRDDTIYPTSGLNGSLSIGRGSVVQGRTRDFDRGLAKLAYFHRLGDRGVFATQAALCSVDAKTPFYLACSLGGSDSFRGYSSTQNIDDALASLQVAYRRKTASRFGYVVFAGTGRVARDVSDLGSAPDLAAAGLGVRFRLSRKFPVDFSADVAVNIDEETSTYIYVGQRF